MIAAALTGCADGLNTRISEIGSPQATQERKAREALAIQEAENARCASFGFRPGTDAFANCRLEMEKAKIGAAGAVMGVASQPVHQRPIDCTSSTFGPTTTTSCR